MVLIGEAAGRVDSEQLRGYPVDAKPHPHQQDGDLQCVEDLRGAHTDRQAGLQHSQVQGSTKEEGWGEKQRQSSSRLLRGHN